MIDEDFRVWLLECNTNPHLGTPCETLKKSVPEMIDEAISLTMDLAYPPKNYTVKERQFELLYTNYDGP